MRIINLNIAEETINETRDNLFAELVVTKSVYVNSHRVTRYELIEGMDDEDKDFVFDKLLDDSSEAKSEAIELMWSRFLSDYDDEAIEKHIIDEATEY
tara:strand:- start:410 stop:703 length:294 start_codon:yes stop_codon:yes gene_type:complete